MTYRLTLTLPRQVDTQTRDEFLAAFWELFGARGLAGVHEGTLLSEQAFERGYETDPWVHDSAEAPESRDWVSEEEMLPVELYFNSEAEAQAACDWLKKHHPSIKIGELAKQEIRDWDAEWKASFKGVDVDPFWTVLPPWESPQAKHQGRRLIRLNPGAGFGTGTHETTQLALGVLGMFKDLSGKTVLDFGSGSGILSLAAAVLGAKVDGVEIDPLAVDNARENLKLNLDLFADRVQFELALGKPEKKYDVIIANILRPVLVANAKKLVERLKPKGRLVLSGIIETDLPHIFKAYDALIPQAKQSLYELREWRAVVYSRG